MTEGKEPGDMAEVSQRTFLTAHGSKVRPEEPLPTMEDEKPPKIDRKGLEGPTAKEAHKINAENKLDKAKHHAKNELPKKQTQTPMEHAKTNQIGID